MSVKARVLMVLTAVLLSVSAAVVGSTAVADASPSITKEVSAPQNTTAQPSAEVLRSDRSKILVRSAPEGSLSLGVAYRNSPSSLDCPLTPSTPGFMIAVCSRPLPDPLPAGAFGILNGSGNDILKGSVPLSDQ